ncbi:MAG TPA: peptidoglycan-binding domain-containing protein [Stellaceae bacterium]|nr:peptidoglycan-binding domain-containing protein [Stellaceae bacterium]
MSSSAAGGASQEDIRQAQEALQDQGLYHGQIDGKWGPQTKQAVSQFQKKNGLKQSAQLDQQTLDDLQNNSSSGSMSGGSSSSGRSPNSSSSFNSGSSGSSSGVSGGNGPATTQTNPGGQNRSSVPSGAPAH